MVTEKQLKSLAQGRASRKGVKGDRVRLNLTVKPSTKAWLEQEGKIGEVVDSLVAQAQLVRGCEFGTMRLVNPDRGRVCVAQIGTLSARTEDFNEFSILSVQGGLEFSPGRRFSRKELAQWLLGEPLLPDDRLTLSDEFGDIPAIAPNPQSWKWYAMRQGEERLKAKFKPTAAEIQAIAGAALSLNPKGFYPLIDPFEIWVCDKGGLEPLALVMTGTSLDDVSAQTISPLWRFNFSKCTVDTELPLRKLREEVNSRINTSTTPGKVGWCQRTFRRNLDGSAIEYSQSLEKIADHAIGYLPDGQLAHPYDRKLKEILGR
jgi:hypothetical protein